jgi:hypothetical protein
MSASAQFWLLEFVLGGLFVAMSSAARFNGPFADRSYTTFQRYAVAVAYYALAYLGMYYVLAMGASGLVDKLGLDVYTIRGFLLGSPPWMALFTVLVIPRLPYLAAIDQRFREHVWYVGGIPIEATRLRNAIRDANYAVKDKGATEIVYTALRRGLSLGTLGAFPDRTLHALYTRAAELKYLVENCARQPRFHAFCSENARPLHDLTRRFDLLSFKTTRALDAIAGLNVMLDTASGKTDNWGSLSTLVENEVYAAKPTVLDPAVSTSRTLINNLRDDMRSYVDDSALLLARLTLYHCWTEHRRVALLQGIGVEVRAVAQPGFRALFPVFSAVLAVMLLSALFLNGEVNSMSLREAVGLTFMVPTFFVTAVFCAVYPKQYFSFANIDVYGRLPYAFFLSAGAAAASISFVIGLAFRALIYQDGERALASAVHKSPYLLIIFTVAAVVAFLIQDRPPSERPRTHRRQRWIDGLWMGLSLGIASAAVQSFMSHEQNLPIDAGLLAGPFVFAALIGGFIGIFVPARFRTSYRSDGRQRVVPVGAPQTRATGYENISGVSQ